jgi:hypothetical protein
MNINNNYVIYVDNYQYIMLTLNGKGLVPVSISLFGIFQIAQCAMEIEVMAYRIRRENKGAAL